MNIVEELRTPCSWCFPCEGCKIMMRTAADRIAELEAALLVARTDADMARASLDGERAAIRLERQRAEEAHARLAAECDHLHGQIGTLAKVLLEEFGGPTCDESACEMVVRVLREQNARLAELRTAVLADHARLADEVERLRGILSRIRDDSEPVRRLETEMILVPRAAWIAAAEAANGTEAR